MRADILVTGIGSGIWVSGRLVGSLALGGSKCLTHAVALGYTGTHMNHSLGVLWMGTDYKIVSPLPVCKQWSFK